MAVGIVVRLLPRDTICAILLGVEVKAVEAAREGPVRTICEGANPVRYVGPSLVNPESGKGVSDIVD